MTPCPFRPFAEIAAFATEAVAVRDAGFTTEALRYPRTDHEVALICAFNGCPLHLAPRGWRYFPNAGTKKAWKRVAAVQSPDDATLLPTGG